MESSTQIIAVASRYGIVMQHIFPDLYAAVRFLKKGEREGKHMALGVFDSASGVVYTIDKGEERNLGNKNLLENLKNFKELGLNATRLEIY